MQWMNQWKQWISAGWRRSLLPLGIVGAIATLFVQLSGTSAAEITLPPSQYASTITAPFNQPDYYPITLNPPSPLYRPIGDWVGRLILPEAGEYLQNAPSQTAPSSANQFQETDWAWLEIHVAPPEFKNLIGKVVRLAWQQEPLMLAYVKKASHDVRFVPSAKKAFQNGVINVIRLDGRNQVGPLQSLAGGHPFDDVEVVLKGGVIVNSNVITNEKSDTSTIHSGNVIQNTSENSSANVAENFIEMPSSRPETANVPAAIAPTRQPEVTLRVGREPMMTTGRFYGLVKILEPVQPQNPADLPQECPGELLCSSDRFQVQHYNPVSGEFDGPQEVIRIPQQPEDHQGVFNMTTRDLEKSPAGGMGWYIYGSSDRAGVFTVRAMKPRSLLQLNAQQTIVGYREALKYINFDNWDGLENKKGTIKTAQILSVGNADRTLGADSGAIANLVVNNSSANASPWKEGTRFLVIHLYGGRGGTHENHESYILGNYAGHFSFGMGQVVRDVITSELQFDYDYLQIYGNGSDGTMAGGNTWTNYMGNLQRGVMGTRPVSDVLIQLDTLTEEYNFGGKKLSFFNELLAELSLVGARYRIGDGSGDSTITSATSCVQDSAQALFLTLFRFRSVVQANPQIVEWIKQNPTDPTTLRFAKLVELAKDLADQLTPLGIVRWDWKENADVLTGVHGDRPFLSIDDFRPRNLLTGLLSWRTALPRQAHDDFAMLFLHNGANLWFLRPNIIGGNDLGVAPLEATLVFGAWKLPFIEVPLLSFLVMRVFGSITIPTLQDWLTTLAILLGFAAIALPFGFSTHFLHWHPWSAPWHRTLGKLLQLLFVPALLKELVFRVLLLPYPRDWYPALDWWAWALFALGVFVAYHWVVGQQSRGAKGATMRNPNFLILITLLGIACTLAYRLTGSIWTITLIHWVAVSVWWFRLGGYPRWAGRKPAIDRMYSLSHWR